MGLSSLPTEVLLGITGFLALRDINSFAQTNHSFWLTLNPTIYLPALKLAERSDDCRVNKLMWAVKNGKFESVQRFIHFCLTKRTTSDPPRTLSIIPSQGPALHAAASLGRADIIKLLLDHGADPYVKDRQGLMPLWIATFYGMTEVMRVLLEFGVRADGLDRNGQEQERMPRNAFLKRFSKKLEVYGEGMQLVPGGATRLNCALPICVAACLGAEESVRVLLDHGANPNDVDVTGDMPLHLAVLRDSPAVVELLIERDAFLEADDDFGRFPLDLALRYSTPQIVKLLIEKGANTQYIEAGRVDPIFRSLESGHFHFRECDPDELSSEELEIWQDDEGSPCGRTTILPPRMINFRDGLNHNNQGYWRHFHLPHDCEQLVECFLERGSKVDSTDRLGRTMLHHAAFHNCEGTVQLLLKRGASPMIKDFFGQTPLHMACAPFWNQPTKIFEMLLEAGADPNVKDPNGEMLLHVTVQTSYLGAIEAMACHPSVELMATNSEGNTALHMAVATQSRDKSRIIQALCRAGSDPYIKNNLDETVWDRAKRHDDYSYSLHGSNAFSSLVDCARMFGRYDVPCDDSGSDSDKEDQSQGDPEALKKCDEALKKLRESLTEGLKEQIALEERIALANARAWNNGRT